MPRGRITPANLVACCVLAAAGCSDASPGTNNNNVFCHDCADSCPPGMVCVDCVCVPEDGGGGDGCGPAALQAPAVLDFGQPQLGELAERNLELVNTGCADLRISELRLVEAGSRAEYSLDPQGAVDLVLVPGAGLLAVVALLQVDDEPDLGQVVVISDDPRPPQVTVELVSSFDGTPVLGVCAFAAGIAAPYPTHPFPQCELDGQGDPLVDFGLLDYGIPAQQVAAVYNSGTGNHPLSITAVTISDWQCHHGAFSVELFRQDAQTGLPVPAALPAHLGPATSAVAPDVLYVTITYDGSLGGLAHPYCELNSPSVEAGLVVQNNDPVTAEAYFGFQGTICYDDVSYLLCPSNCTFTGPEVCGDGVDNDCDGGVDNEGALGCVWHFRDLDTDGYGDPSDSRCLCGPQGAHTTTDGSDCDDDPALCGASCHPGAVELCDGLDDDNDCDGVPDALDCP